MPKYRINGISKDTGRAATIVVEAANQFAAMDVANENGLFGGVCCWVRPSTVVTGSTWLPPRSETKVRPAYYHGKRRFCTHCDRTCINCTGEDGEVCSFCSKPYASNDGENLAARLQAYRARKAAEGGSESR